MNPHGANPHTPNDEGYPRVGAFEVSTIVTTNDGGSVNILLYSKIMSGEWPNYPALAKRVKALFDDISSGENGMSYLLETYNTNGTPSRGSHASPRGMGTSNTNGNLAFAAASSSLKRGT